MMSAACLNTVSFHVSEDFPANFGNHNVFLIKIHNYFTPSDVSDQYEYANSCKNSVNKCIQVFKTPNFIVENQPQ